MTWPWFEGRRVGARGAGSCYRVRNIFPVKIAPQFKLSGLDTTMAIEDVAVESFGDDQVSVHCIIRFD